MAFCCVILIAALPVYAFYPAIMNADSLALYAGAVIPGPVMDWHSPILTWLLRLLIRLGLGVATFVAIQSAIYCFAFYGVLSRMRIGRSARLAILALVMLAPPAMPWLATAEKTSFMTAVLALCFLCSLHLAAAGRTRGLMLGALVALSAIGTWCRPNGIIIFLPIVAFGAWQACRSRRRTLLAASLIGAFLLLGLGAPALAVRASLVVRTWPQQATMDLDLLNLSLRTGKVLIPPDILAAPFDKVKAAMAPDPYVMLGLDTSLRRITRPEDMQRLQSAWLSAIRDYPGIYLRYRFDLYRDYLCFDLSKICLGSWHWYTGGIDANPFGLVSRNIPSAFAFYRRLAGSIVFHPFFDLIATFAVLLGAIAGRRRVVGVYAAILLLFDLSNALLIPGVTVRMAVPLGLMLPLLLAGLYAEGMPPRWAKRSGRARDDRRRPMALPGLRRGRPDPVLIH